MCLWERSGTDVSLGTFITFTRRWNDLYWQQIKQQVNISRSVKYSNASRCLTFSCSLHSVGGGSGGFFYVASCWVKGKNEVTCFSMGVELWGLEPLYFGSLVITGKAPSHQHLSYCVVKEVTRPLSKIKSNFSPCVYAPDLDRLYMSDSTILHNMRPDSPDM